ncbi:MAG TPA: WecB/TagA/CpsF family glycosyltransferase [Candidatus Obscuribacterales bacterium]
MSTLSATNRSRQKVLGYPVDVVDEERALAVVEAAWENHKPLHIVTLNAEMVVAAQQDGELDRIIRRAHLIIPDGAGVVWAVRLSGQQIQRLPGIELAAAALGRAAAENRKVALIGGRQEVLEKLIYCLGERFPGINIVAWHNGYFQSDEAEEIVDEIAHTEPDLLLIALGVPKQEYFIDKWAHRFPSSVMIGVGGSFDVWAGEVKRAPKVMRDLHLEWLYRLVVEPWRWRRIGSALPNFGFQVLHDRLKNKGNTPEAGNASDKPDDTQK